MVVLQPQTSTVQFQAISVEWWHSFFIQFLTVH